MWLQGAGSVCVCVCVCVCHWRIQWGDVQPQKWSMRENKHQRPNVTFLTLHNHCIGTSLGENNTYAVVVNFLSTFNLVGLEVLHQGLHEVLGALASPGVVAAQIGEGRGEWSFRGTGGDWRGWANLFNLACRGDFGFLHTYAFIYIYDVFFLTHVHTHTYTM